MGIDGIGKGGLPPTAPDASGIGPREPNDAIEKPFSVERGDMQPSAPAAAASAAASAPLARLRAGEIDLDRYVDLKVDEATKGLDGLSPSELDDIRKVLRDQMVTDPGLSDLVHMATGRVPTPPEE
jgi:hypothetical protein